MTPLPNQTVENEPLEIWNCLNCRRRKVRCDRNQPCAPCLRRNLQCMFPNSGRLPHRNRISNNAKPPDRKRVELLTRLRRLEAMVGDLGSQIEDASVAADQKLDAETQGDASLKARASSNETSNTSTTYVSENGDGELVVGDPFWSIFCKEVEHIFEAVNGPTAIDLDKHMNTSVENQQRLNYYDFLRTHASATSNSGALRPLPSQMLFLWQIYVENIDPFIKVLHKPTIVRTLYSLKGSFESLGSSTEALLLVVAFAAVTTLEHDEIISNFNVSRSRLVSDYKFTAESALTKADIIRKPDLVTIQAYAVYLGVIEHTTPSGTVWRLNGLLMRAAISLGIHREDTQVTKSSPEIEHHRRLWWQICLLDSSSGGRPAIEFSLSENIFNINLPTNVDDQSLQELIGRPLNGVDGYTDTSIFLLRCQIWRFCQKLRKDMAKSSPLSLTSSLQQFHDYIQKSHLVYFQANEQIHRFVQTTTRLFLNRIELSIHIKHDTITSHSSHDLAPVLYDRKILDLSISIIEDIHELQHDPSWKGWRWQIKGRQPPWRSLHSVLEHLSKNQKAANDRALSAVKKSLQNTPETFRGSAQFDQLSRLLNQVEETYQTTPAEVESRANIADRVSEQCVELSLTLPVVHDTFFDSAYDLGSDPSPTKWNSNPQATGESGGNDVDFSLTLDDQNWDFTGIMDVDGATMWDPWGLG